MSQCHAWVELEAAGWLLALGIVVSRPFRLRRWSKSCPVPELLRYLPSDAQILRSLSNVMILLPARCQRRRAWREDADGRLKAWMWARRDAGSREGIKTERRREQIDPIWEWDLLKMNYWNRWRGHEEHAFCVFTQCFLKITKQIGVQHCRKKSSFLADPGTSMSALVCWVSMSTLLKFKETTQGEQRLRTDWDAPSVRAKWRYWLTGWRSVCWRCGSPVQIKLVEIQKNRTTCNISG